MDTLFIPIILGTAREGRQSEKAAKFVLQEFQKRNQAETKLIDVRDYPLVATLRHPTEKKLVKLGQEFARADGYIVVAPVYNHGYPGELKIVLDVFYEEYKRKPIGICAVTSGGLGGPQMVEQLRLVAVEFQMVPIRSALYFLNISELFDDNGNITDSLYHQRLQTFFDELVWYAKALKKARNP